MVEESVVVFVEFFDGVFVFGVFFVFSGGVVVFGVVLEYVLNVVGFVEDID